MPLRVYKASVPVKNSTYEKSRCRISAGPSSLTVHPSPLGAVMILVLSVWAFLRVLLGRSTAVTLENRASRHQLIVLQRSSPRPRLRRQDRLLWVCLSRLWAHWRSCLLFVQPATVVAWHRQGFRLYWRWKSRLRSPGRPPIDLEIRTLIRRMARENPTWPNSASSAMMSPPSPSPSTCVAPPVTRRLSGGPSWLLTVTTSRPSTSSSYRP